MPSIESLDPDDEGNMQDGEPLGSDGPVAASEPESAEPPSYPASADEPVARSSALRRMVSHKAFVPSVVALGALAAGGVALLATRSPGPSQQLMKAIAARTPELTAGVAENVTGLTTRNSPVAHTVQEYFRQQHYGPNGSQVKLVKVAPYARGVSR